MVLVYFINLLKKTTRDARGATAIECISEMGDCKTTANDNRTNKHSVEFLAICRHAIFNVFLRIKI